MISLNFGPCGDYVIYSIYLLHWSKKTVNLHSCLRFTQFLSKKCSKVAYAHVIKIRAVCKFKICNMCTQKRYLLLKIMLVHDALLFVCSVINKINWSFDRYIIWEEIARSFYKFFLCFSGSFQMNSIHLLYILIDFSMSIIIKLNWYKLITVSIYMIFCTLQCWIIKRSLELKSVDGVEYVTHVRYLYTRDVCVSYARNHSSSLEA